MSLASSASLLTLPVSSAMSFLSTTGAPPSYRAPFRFRCTGCGYAQIRCINVSAAQEGASMDIMDRIRYARDRALDAEQTERQRIAEADNEELQRAASVRLATRQAVREAGRHPRRTIRPGRAV